MRVIALLPLLLAGAFLAACGQKNAPAVSYSDQIKPLLTQYCLECHQPGGKGYEKSGLSMVNYDSLMKGTKLGPVIKPGSAESSTLYRLVAGKADPSIRMPHEREPLTKADIQLIKNWIDQGAMNN